MYEISHISMGFCAKCVAFLNNAQLIMECDKIFIAVSVARPYLHAGVGGRALFWELACIPHNDIITSPVSPVLRLS